MKKNILCIALVVFAGNALSQDDWDEPGATASAPDTTHTLPQLSAHSAPADSIHPISISQPQPAPVKATTDTVSESTVASPASARIINSTLPIITQDSSSPIVRDTIIAALPVAQTQAVNYDSLISFGQLLIEGGKFMIAQSFFLNGCPANAPDSIVELFSSWTAAIKPQAERQRARRVIEDQAGTGLPIRTNSIAVIPFTNAGAGDKLSPLEKGLAEMLSTDLAQVKRLSVLERSQLGALINEMKLGQSGLLDEVYNKRFGKLAGLERVVAGSFSAPAKGKVRLTAKIANAANGEIAETAVRMQNIEQIFALEKELVFSIVKQVGITLTDDERNRIQVIPTRDLNAFLAYSKGLDAQDNGNFSAATGYFHQAVTADPTFAKAREALTQSSAAQTHQNSIAPLTPVVTAPPKPQMPTFAAEVFTVGPLTLSAGTGAAITVINNVNAGFMPEVKISAQTISPSAETPQQPATPKSTERQSFLDANNINITDGTQSVGVKAPIPNLPQ